MKTVLPLVLLLLGLVGCSQSGLQGTNLLSTFTGLSSAVPLSPTGIKLTWALDSQYATYNIYINGSPTASRSETFSNTVISGLIPQTQYSFKVTGVTSSKSEAEVGGSQVATTFKSFQGLTAGGVTLGSETQVNLTWDMNSPTANYEIFQKLSTAKWDLTKPVGTVKGNNQYLASGLTPSQQYCFYIRATYLDSTQEPVFTTEEQINAGAQCIQMTTKMQNLPTVTVSAVVPGAFPWFWTSNGDANYTTEVFELDTNARVAARLGNGTFRSFVNTPEGNKNYYALVSYQSQVSRVSVGLSGANVVTSAKIRSVNDSGTHGPIQPPLMNNGVGVQNFGQQIVSGDFNCDGYTDLAVSMPSAVLQPSVNHYVNTGAVVIYYSYRPTGCVDGNGSPVQCPVQLKTDVAPSTTNVFPNPVLVTYPAVSDDMFMGQVMTVGNFNGDCYEQTANNSVNKSGNCNALYAAETSGTGNSANVPYIRTCDDLAIGLKSGSFYIVYGSRSQGLVAGSGASTAGLNEFTCDSFSNACRASQMTPPAGYANVGFAQAMTAGDFNNDGFSDLAVTAPKLDPAALYPDILIYRGGPQGLVPQGSVVSHKQVDFNTDTTMFNPPASPNGLAATDKFGYSLGTAYNSRMCMDNYPNGVTYRDNGLTAAAASRPKGFDFSKCDDLVIGAPGRSSARGSIFTCKGNPDLTVGGDKKRVGSWTCAEHYPSGLANGAQYGTSILGVKNLNGYPVNNISGLDAANALYETPDTPGAVFVGAPTATVSGVASAGTVFGYYITPLSTDYDEGGIQGILSFQGSALVSNSASSTSTAHTYSSTGIPCDRYNANVRRKTPNTTLFSCNHQQLFMNPLEANAQFGLTMGAVPSKTDDPTSPESSPKMVAIAAPYRSIFKSDGTSGTNAGSVYLYRTDVSTFGSEGLRTITQAHRNVSRETPLSTSAASYNKVPTCTTDCTWYSGGLSPYAPSIFYPNALTANANFGLGGIAGGSFNNDFEGDVAISAPNQDLPTPKAGATYLFYSNSGFIPSENTPAVTLSPTAGLEGSYNFQDAKSVGDLNGDGYDDVVTHINANGVWSIVVYYGSASGLVKSALPSKTATGVMPLLLNIPTDTKFGQAFFPAGDVNGDGYKDLLVIGSEGSYLYYGSSSGLVTYQTPVVSPVGKSPLLFAGKGGDIKFDSFLYSYSYGIPLAPGNAYNGQLQGVSTGDFNKDGYDDLVVRLYSNYDPGDMTSYGGYGDLFFGTGNSVVPPAVQTPSQFGRAVIIYGSVNGPQVNRLTGTIRKNANPTEVVVKNPCTNSTPANCMVQVLGPPHNTTTTGFGYSSSVIRAKRGPTYALYDRLLISDTTVAGYAAGDLLNLPSGAANTGAVYMFEGGPTGLMPTLVQTLVPRDSGVNFGQQIVAAGDINGDFYEDVAISTGTATSSEVYVFYGRVYGPMVCFAGANTPNCSAIDYWAPTAVLDNMENTTAVKTPQIIRPTTVTNNNFLFGWGITALGDFNNDGYTDIAVNVPNGDSTANGIIPAAGYGVILFGGKTGLMVKTTIMSGYPRCYGTLTPICDPYQIFLPNAVTSENTVIHPYSSGDFNGDGLPDLIIGAVGRDLVVPNQKSAQSAGIFYIIY